MATIQFINSRFQSFKDDGTVNAGGTAEFFEPGTSTYKTTYQDSGLTVANSDIITLNAAGAADIWLDGDYDVTIKDAAGVTIDTHANINPPTTGDYGNENLLLNPSFDENLGVDGAPIYWDMVPYAGATIVKDTTGQTHGAGAVKTTTNSPSVGGAIFTYNAFVPVSTLRPMDLFVSLKSDQATIANKVQILWYDDEETLLSTSTLYNESTATPTSWTRLFASTTPPANAVYAKPRLIAADPASGTVGSTWFDDVIFRQSRVRYYATASGTDTYTVTMSPVQMQITTGDVLYIKFTNANTSTVPTLNVDGTGAVTIVKEGSDTLLAGDIPAGYTAVLLYDGTNFVLLNPSAASANIVIKRRQCVLSGAVDANGLPNAISDGGTLDLDLAATSVPFCVTYAIGFDNRGEQDLYSYIDADVTSAWTVTDDATNYLYLDRNVSTGALTYGEVVNMPCAVGYEFPEADGVGAAYSNFDGADAATAFTDANGYAWTFNGNAQLSTSSNKFGTTGVLLDGTGDYLTSSVILEAASDVGGFEIGCWFNMSSTGITQYVMGSLSSFHMAIAINTSNQLELSLGNGSSWTIANGVAGGTPTTLSGSTWYRVRLAWDGATYKVYLSNNGGAEVEEISVTSGTGFTTEATGLQLGNYSSSANEFTGSLDEFWYNKGKQLLGTETPNAAAQGGLQNDGENWFDLSTWTMKEWDQTNGVWVQKHRVFVGEAVASSGSIASVVNYAHMGRYISEWFSTANNTQYQKADNLGTRKKFGSIQFREDERYKTHEQIGFYNDGTNEYGAVIGVSDHLTTDIYTAATYICSENSTLLGSAGTDTVTAGEYRLIVERSF